MHRGQRAIVASVHCLEHVERLGATNLADDDPIRPHAQRVADEVADRDLTVALGVGRACLEADHVLLVQLQLDSVLDSDDSVPVGHEARQHVEQRGLAGSGSTRDEQVHPARHRGREQ